MKPVLWITHFWKTAARRLRGYGLSIVFFTLTAGWASAAAALEFSTETIPLAADQKVAFMPFLSSSVSSDLSSENAQSESVPMLLVIETPDLDEREKQALGLEEPIRTVTLFRQNGTGWERYLHTELDGAMDLVDTVQRGDGIALAGYQRSEVLVLQESTATFQPMLSARSMYVGSNWDASPTFEMFFDLNEDGLDDFLMPDFDGWQVALQQPDGFSAPQTLGPGPRMDFSESSEMVGFRAETPHVFDANGDGRKDLAFWINGRFQIYEQGPGGRFAEDAKTLDPDMNDVLGSFLSVEFGDGDDDAEQPQRLLDAVGDVNGDGFAD
ncbi:MAG: VCBS repeat-containing protein, partial [Pseudomonadota bacterium]